MKNVFKPRLSHLSVLLRQPPHPLSFSFFNLGPGSSSEGKQRRAIDIKMYIELYFTLKSQ